MARATIWWIILGGMLVTYATRLSFIALLPAERLPISIRHALRFAPPAVLAAIAIPEVLLAGEANALDLTSAQALAGLAAALVAWRTSSTWLTITVGLMTLWLLQYLGV